MGTALLSTTVFGAMGTPWRQRSPHPNQQTCHCATQTIDAHSPCITMIRRDAKQVGHLQHHWGFRAGGYARDDEPTSLPSVAQRHESILQCTHSIEPRCGCHCADAAPCVQLRSSEHCACPPQPLFLSPSSRHTDLYFDRRATPCDWPTTGLQVKCGSARWARPLLQTKQVLITRPLHTSCALAEIYMRKANQPTGITRKDANQSHEPNTLSRHKVTTLVA